MLDSAGGLFGELLLFGAILTMAAGMSVLVIRASTPLVANAVGCAAGVLGGLVWADFIVGGSAWRVYPHGPVYEELIVAVTCFLPVREVPGVLGKLSWILLALAWLAVVLTAYDQMRFWGGWGRNWLLDATVVAAIVMPAALAHLHHVGRRKGR